MRFSGVNKSIVLLSSLFLFLSCTGNKNNIFGETTITQWQDNKNGAVSLTYDDGSINQFRVAVPILDSLGFPGTFFIITGDIPGSTYKPQFIGRSADQIIKETAKQPTNPDNLFERASLAAYAPYKGLRQYFTRAGELFESGKKEEACKLIDDAYSKVRKGELTLIKDRQLDTTNRITWDKIKVMASHGHEFASHSVTHPYLCILDEANIQYELEKSRQEILEKLGPQFTFSAECPYGIEDPRVMEEAFKVYPALRNRMPETFMEELDRSSHRTAVNPDKEYVQWQRGPLTATTMETMKAWIDTTLSENNIWLVLVFHGVDGIGWESKTGTELRTYYEYLKSKENNLWIATFGDVTKYMRERMSSHIESVNDNGGILVNLTNSLAKMYDIPLTLKTYVNQSNEKLTVKQGNKDMPFASGKDEKGYFIVYNVIPNTETVQIQAK